jgi:hypothetical protein
MPGFGKTNKHWKSFERKINLQFFHSRSIFRPKGGIGRSRVAEAVTAMGKSTYADDLRELP